MKRYVCLLCLLVPLGAWAEDFVCEDTVTPGKYRRYIGSLDPATLTLQTNEVCHGLTDEATIQTQRALCYDSHVPPPTIPPKYRKVTAGLCSEMPQTEKDQVDAALTAAETVHQSYLNERSDDSYCAKKLLGDISQILNNRMAAKQGQDATAKTAAQQADSTAKTAIKADIDGSTLDRALLKRVVDDYYARVDASRNDYYARVDSDRVDVYGMLEKVSRCLRAFVGFR